MSALQADVVAPSRQPLTISRPGKVLRWQVAVGEQVERGQEIALFDDGKGGAIQITAPFSGRVATLLHAGFPVAAGAAIAQIEPDERPEPLKRAVPIAPPQHTAPAPKIAPSPSGEVLEASEQEPPRRSTLGDPEELVKVEELSLPTPPKPTKRPRRPRVVKRTCHPTDHQRSAFQAALDGLKKDGFDYSAGELDRTMHDLLLTLSKQELIARLEANRDREVAGRYGYRVGPRG